MRVLDLVIKRRYLETILLGRKTREVREVRPSTVGKYIQLDADGYEVEDADGLAVPVHYDAIRFRAGRGDGDGSALVEVVSVSTRVMVDGDGKPIIYEHGRDADGNPLVWVAEQVVYDLGRILERDMGEKSEKV